MWGKKPRIWRIIFKKIGRKSVAKIIIKMWVKKREKKKVGRKVWGKNIKCGGKKGKKILQFDDFFKESWKEVGENYWSKKKKKKSGDFFFFFFFKCEMQYILLTVAFGVK